MPLKTLLPFAFLFAFEMIAFNQEVVSLEKIRNGKIVYIPLSELLDFEIDYYSEYMDSTATFQGSIHRISPDSIEIAVFHEELKYNNIVKGKYKYSSISFDQPKYQSFAKSDFTEIIQYRGEGFKIGFFAAASVGLFSTLVIAPLASIDKKSPQNFNVKRYQTIVYSSLIFTGVTLTVGLSIPGKRRMKFPKEP